jgi:hypothetical protein
MLRCAGADDSYPVAADSALDDSLAECSAAPSTDGRYALAAPTDDCLETVDSAEGGSPGSADCSPAVVAVGSAEVCCSADLAPDDCWVAQTADDRSVPAARMDDWLRAADDSQADSVGGDSPADSARDDYLAWAGCPAEDDPGNSSPVAHSLWEYFQRADSQAARSADCRDDSPLQAVAAALPVARSPLAAHLPADWRRASAAFVCAPPAPPDCAEVPAASPQTTEMVAVACSSQ